MGNKVLQFLRPFKTEAINEFVVEQKFVEGQTIDGVSILSLSDSFKTNLMKKVEKDLESSELRVHKLLVAATNLQGYGTPGVIPKLANKHETMSAHLHQLLAYKQRRKDFTWTTAYIKCDGENGNGALWAVHAIWSGAGFVVGTGIIDSPLVWGAGQHFLSG